MDPKLIPVLFAVAGPVAGAIVTDLDAFETARRTDPAARFDWVLFLVRVARAAVVGAAAGIGLNAIQP